MKGIKGTNFGSRGRRAASWVAAVLLLFAATGPLFAQAIPQKNVNVIGPTPPNTWYVGDTYMQFNESDGACSPNNPRWCAIGMNDYRGVNNPALGDAFPGIAMTRGETWISGLHPDNLADAQNINQQFGADPNLEAVPGMLFYNFIAGWRDDSQPGGVYLSRWYEHNREVGPPWQHKDTLQVAAGTSGRFLDKPTFKVSYLDPSLPDITIIIPALIDPADNMTVLHDEFPLTIPAIRLDLCYAVFVGNDNNDGTRINCLSSLDAGETWTSTKLSESIEINQGVTLATRNFGQDALACWLRFQDNNEDDSIMCAFSNDGAQTWSKAQLVTNFCPFNQGTAAARHRTNALPVAVSNNNEFAVYFASRNKPTGTNDTCILPAKGNKDPVIQMSNVALIDDFDSYGEEPDPVDGSRVRDGLVRTSRNFSRIMMMRSSNPGGPNSWSDPAAIDPQERSDVPECSGQNVACRKNSHQYMPAAFAAGGIETVAYYDTRMDRLNRLPNPITSGFVEDVVVNLQSDTVDPDTGEPLPPWNSVTLLPAGLYELEPPPSNVPPPGNNFALRRNIDVFAAQIVNGVPLNYTVDPDTYYPSVVATQSSPSVRVTQFASRIKRDANGDPVTKTINGITGPVREQAEFNFPNARLFRKGTRPFIGDYNTVYAVNARRENGNWVSNQSALTPANVDASLFPSLEPTFHIGWTTNRDVRGKVYYTGCDRWDETLQMWLSDECVDSEYVTPGAPPMPTGAMAPLQGEGGDDSAVPPGVCSANVGGASALQFSNKGPLTRNQKIYTAKLKPGINVEVVSAIKERNDPNDPGVPLNTFVLSVQNGSPGARRVRLELPTGETNVSFERKTFVPDNGQPPAPPRLFVDVVVPPGASNVRTVFDSAGDLLDPVVASVYDVTSVQQDPEDPNSEPGEGVLVARVALERDSVLPLEPLVAFDPNNIPIDITQEDFFRLLLTRETAAEKTLEFENLEFENLEFENRVKLLDFENSAELLEFENLDFENTLVFLEFENLDFENIFVTNANLADDSYSLADYAFLEFENNVTLLDFENLEFENRTLFSDLEALEFENTFIEALEFENTSGEFLEFENLDFENLEFENANALLEFENLDFENLEFENSAFFSSAVDNADLRNLTLDATQVVDQPSVEVSWKVDSDGNTTTGVDIKPIFSQALIDDLENSGAEVILSVRQLYYTPTVSLTADSNSFCTVQIIAKNQVVYSGIMSPEQVNSFFDDPTADEATTPGFQLDPNVENIITLQIVNPPASFATTGDLGPAVGMAVFAQGAHGACDEDAEIQEGTFDACEILAPPPDTTSPVITVLGDNPLTVEADKNGTYVDPGAEALDDIDGDVTDDIVVTGSVNLATPGDYEITYTVTDSSLNEATPATRMVTVEDTTPPTITLNTGNNTVNEDTVYADPGATASDNVDDDFAATATILDTSEPGMFDITYTATDTAGNPATPVTRTVTVNDTTAPVITLNGSLDLNLMLEAGVDSYIEAGATALDNADGPVAVIVSGDIVNTLVADVYTVIYTATDLAGNVTQIIRTVTVADNVDPIVTIDPDAFTPGAPYVLPAGSPADATFQINWPVDAQDLEDGLSISCVADGGVPVVEEGISNYADGTLTTNFSADFPVGPTSVTCTVIDQGGNITIGTFNVLVEDVPTITVALDPDCNCVPVATDTDGGTTATVLEDDLIALLTVNDFITDPADLAVSCPAVESAEFGIGSHEVTCMVSDTAMPDPNSASVTFTVEVGYRYDFFFDLPKGNLQAGSTLPIDFYYEENGTSVDASTFAPIASWFGPYDAPGCPAEAGSVPGPGEDSGSSNYRWSNPQSLWQFSWQTPILEGKYDLIISPPGTSASTTSVCLK